MFSGTTQAIAQFSFFTSLPCGLPPGCITDTMSVTVCMYLNSIRTYLCVVSYPLQVLCKSTICSRSHRSRCYQCDLKFSRSLLILVLPQAVLSVLYGVWQKPASPNAIPRYQQSIMLLIPVGFPKYEHG